MAVVPLEQFYFPQLGGITILRGAEPLKRRNPITDVEEPTGEYRVYETFVTKFRHDKIDNCMGRLMGPKAVTMKWLRKEFPHVDILADTGAIRFVKDDPKFTICAVGPLPEAKSRLQAALDVILPLLNQMDPRNHVVSGFQAFCKDQLENGLEVDWRLENFRTNPLLDGTMAAYRNPASFYVKGLSNTLVVRMEPFPACLPGFRVGEPLPNVDADSVRDFQPPRLRMRTLSRMQPTFRPLGPPVAINVHPNVPQMNPINYFPPGASWGPRPSTSNFPVGFGGQHPGAFGLTSNFPGGFGGQQPGAFGLMSYGVAPPGGLPLISYGLPPSAGLNYYMNYGARPRRGNRRFN